MNINKDNYEEYFLLYADNELTLQQKEMVSAFVNENPELAEEFFSIKQSVLSPDADIRLADKAGLFRHTEKFITEENYTEIFSRYIDNELSGTHERETDQFLELNPRLKKEFEYFGRSKTHADKSIVFPNKRLLYKNIEGGRIVPFKWWRAVAAALLLGVGLWVFNQLNGTTSLPATATVASIPSPLPLNKLTASAGSINNKPPTIAKDIEIEKKPVLAQKRKGIKRDEKVLVKNTSAQKKLPVITVPEPSKEEVAVAKINMVPEKKLTNNLPRQIRQYGTNELAAVKSEVAENTGVKKPAEPEANTFASTTSFAADAADNNDNFAFYNVSEQKFNKSKIGGFLRKVKRVIERKITPFSNSKDQREVAVN